MLIKCFKIVYPAVLHWIVQMGLKSNPFSTFTSSAFVCMELPGYKCFHMMCFLHMYEILKGSESFHWNHTESTTLSTVDASEHKSEWVTEIYNVPQRSKHSSFGRTMKGSNSKGEWPPLSSPGLWWPWPYNARDYSQKYFSHSQGVFVVYREKSPDPSHVGVHLLSQHFHFHSEPGG